jgi:predicted nucleic acid-binding protein
MMYIINRRQTGHEHTLGARGLIIYPDSCIYGRQSDDHTQADIEAEFLAIGAIFDICRIAGHIIVGSKIVEREISDNPNLLKRMTTFLFFKRTAMRSVELTAANIRHAGEFMAQGLDDGDSLHLAAAEAAGADVLLTVDKDFIRIAANRKLSKVRVLNPFNFLQEVTT